MSAGFVEVLEVPKGSDIAVYDAQGNLLGQMSDTQETTVYVPVVFPRDGDVEVIIRRITSKPYAKYP